MTKNRFKLTASNADKFDLYQRAIQGGEIVDFLDLQVRKVIGGPPRTFREDFCGTALNCCEFVKLHPSNRAIGVDINKSALLWCQKNNYPDLTEAEWDQITLIHGDVITVETEPVDFIAALNFSYAIFQERRILLKYFQNAKRSLKRGGVLLIDVHGGPSILKGDVYKNRLKDFTYVCDGSPVDPITNRFHLDGHFLFPDGSKLSNAFQYDMRLWSIPELLDLFAEAGFQDAFTLWEGTARKTGRGNGVYRRMSKTGNQSYPAWLAFIAAIH